VPADTTPRDRLISTFNKFRRAEEEWRYTVGDVAQAELTLQQEVDDASRRLRLLTAPEPQLAAAAGDSGLLPAAKDGAGGLFACPADDFSGVEAMAPASLAAAVYRGYRQRKRMLEEVQRLRRGVAALERQLPEGQPSAVNRYAAVTMAGDVLGRPALSRYGRRLLADECTPEAWARLLVSTAPPPPRQPPPPPPPAAVSPDDELAGADAVTGAAALPADTVAAAGEADEGADGGSDGASIGSHEDDDDASVDTEVPSNGIESGEAAAAAAALTAAEELEAAATLAAFERAVAVLQQTPLPVGAQPPAQADIARSTAEA
jgi:hypothetical protein